MATGTAQGYIYIAMTILFTVYSQLIIKWKISTAGPIPETITNKAYFIGSLLISLWVVSAVIATFFAGISWMLTMTRFELSYAFPFIGLNFVSILLASVLIFNESISIAKIMGTLIIVIGVAIVAKG